jgi:hypothetical protein
MIWYVQLHIIPFSVIAWPFKHTHTQSQQKLKWIFITSAECSALNYDIIRSVQKRLRLSSSLHSLLLPSFSLHFILFLLYNLAFITEWLIVLTDSIIDELITILQAFVRPYLSHSPLATKIFVSLTHLTRNLFVLRWISIKLIFTFFWPIYSF